MPAAGDTGAAHHQLTAREASAIIEALRYLQRDMEEDRTITSDLALPEIDSLCDRLTHGGTPVDARAEHILAELVSAVRDLKDFGGSGGTEAEETVTAALDKAEQLLN